MSKKKILSLCLVICLLATAIGGTLAYFTDSDMDQNVMTSGNVKIVQNETNRNGKAYEDGQTLMPAVYRDADGNISNDANTTYRAKAEVFTGPDGKNMDMYVEPYLGNVIDKVVSVTNTGTLPAYVRTILLVEDTADGKLTDQLHMLWAGKNQGVSTTSYKVKVNNQNYQAVVFTYQDPLAAKATSKASLQQVWLDPNTGSDWYNLLGDGNLEIIALSQAAQVDGFTGAGEALNTAFGTVTDENVARWLNETTVKTTELANVVTVPEASEPSEG